RHHALWRALCATLQHERGQGRARIMMIWFYWVSGVLLALIWLASTLPLAWHISDIADLTQPGWEVPAGSQLPSLTIVVPARNEEAEIEPALRSLLQLNYPQFEVVAVDD